MLIVTAQTVCTPMAGLTVRGDIVKIDLGAILIEMDKEGFKKLITDLITQAAKNQIYI
jgi:hypothetical protein